MALVGLGLDELSMNGPSIPLVKKVIRSASAADGQALVGRLLDLTSADEMERAVRSEMARRFPGLLEAEASVGPVGGVGEVMTSTIVDADLVAVCAPSPRRWPDGGRTHVLGADAVVEPPVEPPPLVE